jgi:hypothetical protein
MHLYVSDTGAASGATGDFDPHGHCSIYIYDLNQHSLPQNKRLLATVANGVPDGFKVRG